jgi:hypothetical protein
MQLPQNSKSQHVAANELTPSKFISHIFINQNPELWAVRFQIPKRVGGIFK